MLIQEFSARKNEVCQFLGTRDNGCGLWPLPIRGRQTLAVGFNRGSAHVLGRTELVYNYLALLADGILRGRAQ